MREHYPREDPPKKKMTPDADEKWICSHLIQNPRYASPRVAR
jgi:hypothetical protein